MEACRKVIRKPIQRYVLGPIEPALKHWHRTADLFCFGTHVASWLASVPALSALLQCTWKTNANHAVDLLLVGSLTHADNKMAFVLKSLRSSVNRIPMLTISGFRGEPPITIRALRALHHPDEPLPNITLPIASAPISHDPRIGRTLNITGMHFSHLLHRRSVDKEVQVPILIHVNAPNLSIKELALCGWLATLACLDTSPQNRLTDFWRGFRA